MTAKEDAKEDLVRTVVWTCAKDFAAESGGFSMHRLDFHELMSLFGFENPDEMLDLIHQRSVELGKNLIIGIELRLLDPIVYFTWKPADG